VGTKRTEKVPAQEDQGRRGGKGGSLSTPLALAIPGYTHCQALHHPYLESVGSYGLCDGETKGGAERPQHRLFNATFTGERVSRRDTSGVQTG